MCSAKFPLPGHRTLYAGTYISIGAAKSWLPAVKPVHALIDGARSPCSAFNRHHTQRSTLVARDWACGQSLTTNSSPESTTDSHLYSRRRGLCPPHAHHLSSWWRGLSRLRRDRIIAIRVTSPIDRRDRTSQLSPTVLRMDLCRIMLADRTYDCMECCGWCRMEPCM